jgi:hypothetical protein
MPLLYISVTDDDVPLTKAFIRSGADPNVTEADIRFFQLVVPGKGDNMKAYSEHYDGGPLIDLVRSPEMLEVLVEEGALVDGPYDELQNDEDLPIYSSQSEEIFDKFLELGSKIRDPESARKNLKNGWKRIKELSSGTNLFDIPSAGDSFMLSNEEVADSIISGKMLKGFHLHSNPAEEKSVLEIILNKTNSMKKVIEAVNMGISRTVENNKGQSLTDIVRDNHLRLKILLQHGFPSYPWMLEIPFLKQYIDESNRKEREKFTS